MSRWQITKYVKSNPTNLERLYAYFFIAPADILLPGNEWRNNGKSIYQTKIKQQKPVLRIIK